MCETVWHGREAISDNGRHWRPLTFQWLTVAVFTVNLPPTVQVNATRGIRRMFVWAASRCRGLLPTVIINKTVS